MAAHEHHKITGRETPLGAARDIDEKFFGSQVRLERRQFIALVAAVLDPAVENSEQRHREHAVIDHSNAVGRNSGQAFFSDLLTKR